MRWDLTDDLSGDLLAEFGSFSGVDEFGAKRKPIQPIARKYTPPAGERTKAKAEKIVAAIRSNMNDWDQRRIDYEEFTARQRKLWDSVYVDRSPYALDAEVHRLLRKDFDLESLRYVKTPRSPSVGGSEFGGRWVD